MLCTGNCGVQLELPTLNAIDTYWIDQILFDLGASSKIVKLCSVYWRHDGVTRDVMLPLKSVGV